MRGSLDSGQVLFLKPSSFLRNNITPLKPCMRKVIQIPPDESDSIPTKILELTQDLEKLEARDPETRLRILTIKGVLETN